MSAETYTHKGLRWTRTLDIKVIPKSLIVLVLGSDGLPSLRARQFRKRLRRRVGARVACYSASGRVAHLGTHIGRSVSSLLRALA